MEKYYFKSQEKQGDVYLQLRYYTPSIDSSYEAIIILINPNGVVNQFYENYSEADFKFISQKYLLSSDSEFVNIQERYLLNGKRVDLYNLFYNQWKEYYTIQKLSIQNVKQIPFTNNWDYQKRLENEYQNNGFYAKRIKLEELKEGIKQQKNPSLFDIYKEARMNATIQYTIGNI